MLNTSAAQLRRRAHLAILLAGVSGFSLGAAGPAQARVIGPPGAASAVMNAAALAQAAAAQAAAAAAQVQQSLARSSLAIRTQLATQAAARAAAATANNLGPDPNHPGLMLPNVPDGLDTADGRVTGGLRPDTGPAQALGGGSYAVPSSWLGISALSQTASSGQTTVTLTQNQPAAVATWQTFNVGRNTTVHFDQTAGNATTGNGWVVLNRVLDPSGVPSQILGQIKAEGTVLLINRNGIIFGGSSQVNVHSLIASAFDLGGITGQSVYDSSGNGTNYASSNANFVANGLFTAYSNVANNQVVFQSGSTLTSTSVTTQPGAIINSIENGADNGGFVALLGPRVNNGGAVQVSAGDLILASGAGVALGQPTTNPTADGNVQAGGGVNAGTALTVQLLSPFNTGSSYVYNINSLCSACDITNTGMLLSQRGEISLVGGNIQQLGIAAATSSITRPGVLTLSASLNGSADIVTLGANSLTAVLPEENGETTPSDPSSLANFIRPQMYVVGQAVSLQGSELGTGPGAAIFAPGGNVQLTAATAYLGANSVIDVGGLPNVPVPISNYILTFKVTQNEVADDPLARNLIGQTVTVDLRKTGFRTLDGLQWYGSPLFTLNTYLGSIPQTIDQLLTKGGSVSFSPNSGSPGGTVVTAPGSVINVSGGSIAFQGGKVATTRLIGSDGRLYDIGSADPTLAYGIYGGFAVDHHAWGRTDIYNSSLLSSGYFAPSYTDGIDAGSINIAAGAPVLEGSLFGLVAPGSIQRIGASGGTSAQSSPDQLPWGGRLSLNLVYSGSLILQNDLPDLLTGSNSQISANPFQSLVLPSDFPISTAMISAGGFSQFSLKYTGNNSFSSTSFLLKMRPGATLTVRPGGSIALDGVVEIDGTLNAPSGSISLSRTGGRLGSGGVGAFPVADILPNNVVIGPTALLNVAGLWTNDAGLSGDALQGKAFVNGGSISITSQIGSVYQQYNVISGSTSSGSAVGETVVVATDRSASIVLAQGSVFDLSGGGHVNPQGVLQTGSDGLPLGKGGSLSLTTGGSTTGGWQVGDVQQIATSAIVLAPAGGGATVTIAAGSTLNEFNPPFGEVTNSPWAPTAFIAGLGGSAPNQSSIVLGGSIYAHGFDGGGTLSLTVPLITVDGNGANATAATSYLSSAAIGRLGAPTAGVQAAEGSGHQSGEIVLSAGFFGAAGFSRYVLNSNYGSTTVTSGTTVVLKQTTFLSGTPGLAAQRSGALPRNFASIGVPLDIVRPPVSLALDGLSWGRASSADLTSDGSVSVQAGARIVGDPGANISISTGGAATELGEIDAPGGRITILSSGPYAWIGPNAVLDVDGAFIADARVTRYQTGKVLDAGTIAIGSVSTLVQSGAQLDLRGASASIQVPHGGLTGPRFAAQEIWSNGGTLAFGAINNGSTSGNIYFGGTINAAGGSSQAAGGTLIIGDFVLTDPLFNSSNLIANNIPLTLTQGGDPSAGVTPASLQFLSTQVGAFFAADSLNNYAGNPARNSGLDSIVFNGFNGNNNSNSKRNLQINVPGSVKLAVPNSIILDDAPLTPPASGTAAIEFDAGYIQIAGSSVGTTLAPATSSNVAVTFHAGRQLDLAGFLQFPNAGVLNLISDGDIRLLPYTYPGTGVQLLAANSGATAYNAPFFGYLVAAGNINLAARQIYPATDTIFMLQSVGTTAALQGDGSISGFGAIVVRSTGAPLSAPLSAAGGIVLDAQVVWQGGTLVAPLGTIVLGLGSDGTLPGSVTAALTNTTSNVSGGSFSKPPINATTTVVTAPGSLTSVSALGLDIPYGYTVDGQTWYDGNSVVSGVVVPNQLTAPPGKVIAIGGQNVDLRSGSSLDASGGGDIYAVEYVSGTGGTRNILTAAQPNVLSPIGLTTYTSLYPDGRQVYALVPSYLAPVSAYDTTVATFFGQSLSGSSLSTSDITPGTAIYLPGGNGIKAGVYTLLPGMYATLPGAYRVVQMTGAQNVQPGVNVGLPDGSRLVSGYFTNSITNTQGLNGQHAANAALFDIESSGTWSGYSQINITSGNAFFIAQAISQNSATPRLPIDAGRLSLGASGSLNISAGVLQFAPMVAQPALGLPAGRGGQVDISASNILVVAQDQAQSFRSNSAYSSYLFVDASQISGLGVESVLIGGSRSDQFTGNQLTSSLITAKATNLEVATDGTAPLTGPELIFVSAAGGRCIVVDSGSQIATSGSVSAGADIPITIGTTGGVSGDGSLLRLTNGDEVSVTRLNLPAVTAGQIAIKAGASLSAKSLTIDTSGSATVDSGVNFSARRYLLSGNVITLGNSLPSGNNSGFIISPGLIASLAGADAVTLRSASVINLNGGSDLKIGDPGNAIGMLTLDSAGLVSKDSFKTTIYARNVDIIDSQPTPNGATGSGGGSLVINAGVGDDGAPVDPTQVGTLTFDLGYSNFSGFSSLKFNAAQAIVFSGGCVVSAGACAKPTGATVSADPSGIVTGVQANAANVTFTAPEVVVAGSTSVLIPGSSQPLLSQTAQTFVTTGSVTFQGGLGNALPVDPSNIGGSLIVKGGSVTAQGGAAPLAIMDQSGSLTLDATGSDVNLNAGASILAKGTAISFGSIDAVTQYAPGGTVKLIADQGNVAINGGALIDVSSAQDSSGDPIGFAGILSITTPTPATTTLSGTLLANAMNGDFGGTLIVDTGSIQGSSTAQALSAFTGNISVHTRIGDIVIGPGSGALAPAIAARQVLLIADGGLVDVAGTIDASGPKGGSISLYGGATGGVMIESGAVLLANATGATSSLYNAASLGVGGTITLGTVGTPAADAGGNALLNSDGSEQITSSGKITVQAGATLNVGGSVQGGQIILRAPILSGGNTQPVNVSFKTNNVLGVPAGGVVLDAYKTWNTQSGSPFDGIIDPAGWFTSSGAMIDGTWSNIGLVTLSVVNKGTGLYSAPPTVTISGGGGSGAAVNVVMAVSTTSTNLNVGSGFAAGTYSGCSGSGTVTCTSGSNKISVTWTGGGSGATLGSILVANSGVISSVKFSGGGTNFTSAPMLTFTGGTGNLGKTATAQVPLTISSITMTSAGSGYTSMPTITIGAPLSGTAAAVGFNLALGSATETGGVLKASTNPTTTIVLGGSGIFTPAAGAVNTNHVSFYGDTTTIDPNTGRPIPGTLETFIQNPFGQSYTGDLFTTLSVRPEINLVNPSSSLNSGAITVASNWNLGAGTVSGSSFTPIYRTSVGGEPGVLSLMAVGNIAVKATISDGFYELTDPFGATLPAKNPANNQSNNPTVADPNTTAAASLMPATLGGSFSYVFTAGADFSSANPTTTLRTSKANFTVDQHTTYNNPQFNATTTPAKIIAIPTLIRTGTGSISIAAPGSVQFLDTFAPGAIYTAGAGVAIPAGFIPPAMPTGVTANGLVNTPTWAQQGGSITVLAGLDIQSTEMPLDDASGTQTGKALRTAALGLSTSGEAWTSWLYRTSISNSASLAPFAGGTQTASWVNTATFFQGFGALGGGNITLNAGRNILDVSASIPETLAVTGGTSNTSPAVANYFGGGDLVVKAGGNLSSGMFLVGRGTGLITVGGNVAADRGLRVDGSPQGTSNTLPPDLLLGMQDASVMVTAAGSLTIGNVLDPDLQPINPVVATLAAALPGPANFTSSQPGFGQTFTSFDPSSSLSAASLGGDLTFVTNTANANALFDHNSGFGNTNLTTIQLGAPPVIGLTALRGNIALDNFGNTVFIPMMPTATGNLSIFAGQDIELGGLIMADAGAPLGADPLGRPVPQLTAPLHAGDPNPVRIYAGQDIIDGRGVAGQSNVAATASQGSLWLIKPAMIEAGRDIVNLDLVGENNAATDVTAIIAGRDILGYGASNTAPTGSYYVIYGPGTFLMQAGRNVGPFLQSAASSFNSFSSGVAAIGDGSAASNLNIPPGSALGFNIFPPKLYLPHQSATIDVLFGVAPGIDYVSAYDQYILPPGGTGGISFLSSIGAQLDALGIGCIAGPNGCSVQARLQSLWPSPTTNNAPPLLVRGIIDQAFLDFLGQAGADYLNAASPNFGKISRAYAAIETLFPAHFGYTQNNDTGVGAAGAAFRIQTGNLSLPRSVIETQQNSNINLIGPGGNILVGSNSLDALQTNQQGILTLGGGAINSFTDGSVIVNQSRIMTEQGGNIDLFSANADLNAGKGLKSKRSAPHFQITCTADMFCFVNPSGLVTGAGIAALLTVPGQDPNKSNVQLVAPHGTVDIGAAGVRGTTVGVVAARVLNAFNIQATSVAGLPTFTAPPVAALTNANNDAGSQQAKLPAAESRSAGQPSVIIVEFVGFGGDDNSDRNKDSAPKPECPAGSQACGSQDRRTQNPNSPYQVLGGGDIADDQVMKMISQTRGAAR